jgi:polyisoprenoid-binding protein YceI
MNPIRRSVSAAVAVAGLALSAVAFAAAPVPTGNYKVDAAHSGAFFEVGHLGGVSRFMGRFNDITGDLVVDAPEKSKISVTIKTDSIDSNHEGLDKHLKSPDFFNAVQFPTMTFLARRSFSIALAAAGLAFSAVAFAAAPAAPAGNYKIDGAHSGAFFEVGHMGGVSRFMGRFNDISGDLVVDAPEKSRIKVDVKTESVDSNHEGLDKHLKSPDFFNVVQFPTLTFTSSQVRLDGKGEGTVAGNLNLHGVTKPVTLKIKQIGAGKGMKGEQRVGYVATTTIKRTDFGMNYAVPAAATDEVDLRINIEAIKQ